MATGLLMATMVCVYFYRKSTAQTSLYETVKGEGYHVGIGDIGKWR